jgi:hypothetical protein
VNARVRPSISNGSKPFTLEQELHPFGTWVDEPIWVPPKEANESLAKTMLKNSRMFASREERWQTVIDGHRDEFTHVREIDLTKASIRLPQGKFFVSVLEQHRFDEITDKVPACVQTRLDEFMAGPGQQPGVKVYYLKPLCVEADGNLILTNREAIDSTVERIQEEVFEEFHDMYLNDLPRQVLINCVDGVMAGPRRIAKYFMDRKQRALDAFEAKLEFQRRKIAMRAAKAHRRCRTSGCTFDDMLSLTDPLQRRDVVQLYSIDKELTAAKRKRLLRIAAGTLPWFVSLSLGAALANTAYAAMAVTVTVAPPLVVCDPAFVAEMPNAPGVLLKIGHFDEVDGVTHVEI